MNNECIRRIYMQYINILSSLIFLLSTKYSTSFQLVATMNTPTNTDVPPTQTYSKTFYRRQLPETAISFSSPKGREIFASAMASGGTSSFFPLIEQLQTQPEPAFCGLTTLVIVLNALAVDPRRSWKGPWRW